MRHATLVLVTFLVAAMFATPAFAQDEDFDEEFSLDDSAATPAPAAPAPKANSAEPTTDAVYLVFYNDAEELIVLKMVDEGTTNPIQYFSNDVPNKMKEIFAAKGVKVGDDKQATFFVFSQTGLEAVSLTKETIANRLATLNAEFDNFLANQGCTQVDDPQPMAKAKKLLSALESDLADAGDDEKAEIEAEIQATKTKIETLQMVPPQMWVCGDGSAPKKFAQVVVAEGYDKCTEEEQAKLVPYKEGLDKALADDNHGNIYLFGSALIEALPEHIRDQLVAAFLGATMIKSDDAEKGDILISRNPDGQYITGALKEAVGNELVLVGDDGQEYRVSKDSPLWRAGKGSAASVGGGDGGAFLRGRYTLGAEGLWMNVYGSPAKNANAYGGGASLGIRLFGGVDSPVSFNLNFGAYAVAVLGYMPYTIDNEKGAEFVGMIGANLRFNLFRHLDMSTGANAIFTTGGFGWNVEVGVHIPINDLISINLLPSLGKVHLNPGPGYDATGNEPIDSTSGYDVSIRAGIGFSLGKKPERKTE